MLDIPVFHDDQHGTAIISGAGLINALEITGKAIEDVNLCMRGRSCRYFMFKTLCGAWNKEGEYCYDRQQGVVNSKRKDLNKYKEEFVTDRDISTLAEAVSGADIFLGLSAANVLTKEMLASMADKPVVFAMANPDPEITYEDAMATRDDLIFATGRSDYPIR